MSMLPEPLVCKMVVKSLCLSKVFSDQQVLLKGWLNHCNKNNVSENNSVWLTCLNSDLLDSWMVIYCTANSVTAKQRFIGLNVPTEATKLEEAADQTREVEIGLRRFESVWVDGDISIDIWLKSNWEFDVGLRSGHRGSNWIGYSRLVGIRVRPVVRLGLIQTGVILC